MQEESEWDALKQFKKEKFDEDRARFLKSANENNDGGWTIHTDYHWSRMVAGSRLDYWPSRNKFQYKGKVQRGNVISFIKRQEANQ